MSRSIDSGDRVTNKYTPVDPGDRTLLNAIHVMSIFDKIVDGGYRIKVIGGTTSERDVVSAEVRDMWFNTDYTSFEIYTSSGWLIISGVWTITTRPGTSNIAAGSRGFNTTLSQNELWDGSEWRIA